MWFKNHWPVAATVVVALWQVAFKLIGIGGDVDFLVTRSQDPGWVRRITEWILDPPSWTIAPSLAIGLLLIWWDARKNRASSAPQVSDDAEIPFIKTSLRLRFSGRTESPEIIDQANVFGHYTFWTEEIRFRSFDDQRKEIAVDRVISPSFLITVIFEHETNYTEMRALFSLNSPDRYEVKIATTRYAVLLLSGPVPECEIEITARR